MDEQSQFEPVYIDDKPYEVHFLTDGSQNGIPNEWDPMMTDLRKINNSSYS